MRWTWTILAAGALLLAGPARAQWSHVSLGAQGGYDFPLRTYWDGAAWSSTGTVPDVLRSAADIRYQQHLFEVTGHGRPAGSPTPFAAGDFETAVRRWSAAAGGREVHFWNDAASVVADGSLDSIQVLVSFPIGTLTEGSPLPSADGPGGDAGHGMFAAAFPPRFDAARPVRYPVLFVSPGSGCTSIDYVFGCDDLPELAAPLLVESGENGGRGLLVIVGNAGGQGSQGLSAEYARAVDEVMVAARDLANADIAQVVTTGGSRGGSNTLLHASRPGRPYRVVAAFAAVPPVRYGALGRLRPSLQPAHDFFQLACWADAGCADAWRWDHAPAPGTEPSYVLETLTGSPTFAGADARSPRAFVGGFDDGAWVEITAGPRDYVAGAGLAEEYVGALPARVSWRLDRVYGSAHGGAGWFHDSHRRLFVLDRLAGNARYAGRFAAEVAPGLHVHRLHVDGPDAFCGDRPECYDSLGDAAGCGTPPPVAILPWKVQRVPATGATEPADLVVLGQPGRGFRVSLRSEVGGGVEVRAWDGVLGERMPAGCDAWPVAGARDAVRCTFAGGLEACATDCGAGCQGACGWRLDFDCDGDGLLEEIDSTFTPFRGAPPAQLWVMDEQCYQNDCVAPPELTPYFGFPISLTPCLNPASLRCEPTAYTSPPAPDAGTGTDGGRTGADAGVGPRDAGRDAGADAGGGRPRAGPGCACRAHAPGSRAALPPILAAAALLALLRRARGASR